MHQASSTDRVGAMVTGLKPVQNHHFSNGCGSGWCCVGPTVSGSTFLPPIIAQDLSITFYRKYTCISFPGNVQCQIACKTMRNTSQASCSKAFDFPHFEELHACPKVLMSSWFRVCPRLPGPRNRNGEADSGSSNVFRCVSQLMLKCL